MNTKASIQSLSTLSLILLIVGAVDSIRTLPAAAWFGSQLIFFFIFSAIIFLIPVGLVSAELSTIWSEEESGIYGWVKHAFGKKLAFITIWLQWINTLVWYPTILLFISSTLAYLIDPELTKSPYFATIVSITLFWTLTFLGLNSLHASARIAGICAILGMIIPMSLVIFLGFLWVGMGHTPAIQLDWQHLIPDIKHQESWISLTAIMTSFLGMELAAVHVRQIRAPQKTYPKAIFYSVLLILITMILGSLSIAIVLPKKEINLVLGVLQTCAVFLEQYHLSILFEILLVLIFIGSTGSMINWVLAPSKGMTFAAQDGFIPKWLAHRDADGTPRHLLIIQAIIVTILCSCFKLLPSMNAIYWFFTALSTELYILMYVLMFLAAIKIKKAHPNLHRPFAIPGKNVGFYLTCILGLIGCAITLYVGFFPPAEALSLDHPEAYKYYFGLGLFIMTSPILLGLRFHNKKQSKL
jgi:hypothetical protein